MAIISISLSDVMMKEIDDIKDSLNFTSRSEVIRAGIRTFLQNEKQKETSDIKESAILLVVHQDKFDEEVAGIKHNYEDLIKTHLHNKIDGKRCVEMFLLDGLNKSIESITNGFLVNRKMDTVKLVTLT